MNEFSAVISMPLYFFSPNSNIVFRNQMESWVLFFIQLFPEICFFFVYVTITMFLGSESAPHIICLI